MRILHYYKDTITVTRNGDQSIILSYRVGHVTKVVTSILHPNITADTIIKYCKALGIKRLYLDYNSNLFETLSLQQDIQVFYKAI